MIFLYGGGVWQIILSLSSLLFMGKNLKNFQFIFEILHNDYFTFINLALFSIFADIFVSSMVCDNLGKHVYADQSTCDLTIVLFLKSAFAILSLGCLLFNSIYPLLYSSNRRLTKNEYSLRRDFHPEIFLILNLFYRIIAVEFLHPKMISIYFVGSILLSFLVCYFYNNGTSVIYFRATNYYLFWNMMTLWAITSLSI